MFAEWSSSTKVLDSTSLALVPAASARCYRGMTPGELAAVRRRLEEFAAEMFAPLARRDQRHKGATYVRGLLLDERRKSMQPIAARLGVDQQGCSSSSRPGPGRWSRCASGWPAGRSR